MRQISHLESVTNNIKAPFLALHNKFFSTPADRFASQCFIFTGLGFMGFFKDMEKFPNINPMPLAFYTIAGTLFACSQSKNSVVSTIGKTLAITALGVGCMSYFLSSQSEIAASINNISPTVTEMLPTLLRIASASLGLAIGENVLGALNL